jgi:hypothetical protein
MLFTLSAMALPSPPMLACNAALRTAFSAQNKQNRENFAKSKCSIIAGLFTELMDKYLVPL